MAMLQLLFALCVCHRVSSSPGGVGIRGTVSLASTVKSPHQPSNNAHQTTTTSAQQQTHAAGATAPNSPNIAQSGHVQHSGHVLGGGGHKLESDYPVENVGGGECNIEEGCKSQGGGCVGVTIPHCDANVAKADCFLCTVIPRETEGFTVAKHHGVETLEIPDEGL